MAASTEEDEVALRLLGIVVNGASFDWGPDKPHVDYAAATILEKKGLVDQMPFTAPSGLDSLKRLVNSSNIKDGHLHRSKDLLRTLLNSHNVCISPELSPQSSSEGDGASRYNQLLLSGDENNDNINALIASRDVSIRGLSDRAVAELTVDSRTSLFGSILRMFDMDRVSESDKKNNPQLQQFPPQEQQQNDPMIMEAPLLSTAEIVRTVHLTCSPGDIPAGMDSKEYTQAALHFLSTHVPFISENESEYRTKNNDSSSSDEGWEMLRRSLPVLPLIKAINPEQSLESRVYGRVRPLVTLGFSERKQYPDSIDKDMDFRRKALNLERIFTSSLPFPMKEFEPFIFQKYMPRRKLVPRIEGGAKEELTLMISGHMPGPKLTKIGLSAQSSTISSPGGSLEANSNVASLTVEKSSQQSEVKPSSDELSRFMDKWVATNCPNLMPSLKQKETIIEETGVDKKRLESWFYRARKKMKRTHSLDSADSENVVPLASPTTDLKIDVTRVTESGTRTK